MTLACGNPPFHSIQSRKTLANSESHRVTSHQCDTNYTPPMASAGYALCKRKQLKLAVLCDIPSALEGKLHNGKEIHNGSIIWQPQALGNESFLTATYLVRLELVAGSGDRGQNLEPPANLQCGLCLDAQGRHRQAAPDGQALE